MMSSVLKMLVVGLAATSFLVSCQKETKNDSGNQRKVLNPPTKAPKTILVRVANNGSNQGQAEYLEVNREVDQTEIPLLVNDPNQRWKPMGNNQQISNTNGFPNPNMASNQPQYFIQNPNTYQPHPQQPMGQDPWNRSSPYTMGQYYSANQYPGMMGYYGGGIYAPNYGYGCSGGYGCGYGYGYGYYGYPNYYGYSGYGYGYNHYYPYYYYGYGYSSYYYQPCYYYGNSYWYYYPYYTSSCGVGYSCYGYAGWWY